MYFKPFPVFFLPFYFSPTVVLLPRERKRNQSIFSRLRVGYVKSFYLCTLYCLAFFNCFVGGFGLKKFLKFCLSIIYTKLLYWVLRKSEIVLLVIVGL
uniref:Uncharacterized protein MANES_16G007000 n=1 Tax=Rhizophora mucronata TaxID=61149 RepID=A0A2P2K7A3_RHIMU